MSSSLPEFERVTSVIRSISLNKLSRLEKPINRQAPTVTGSDFLI